MKNMKRTLIMVPLSMIFLVACGQTESTGNAVDAVADAAKTAAAETVNSGVEVVKEAAEVPATVADAAGTLTIFPSAEETQPLQVGDAMPAFTVQAVDGATVPFAAGIRAKPIMMVTYRGGWCPFCNVHLEELQDIVPELTNNGMEVFFFSGDRAEVLYSGLKDGAKAVSEEKQYTIYSDANTEAASALGIAFKLPDEQAARMIDSPRRDLADGSIAKHGALSVPSVFIIGTSGKVEFVHTDPDYRVRISNEDLLAAANAVLAK